MQNNKNSFLVIMKLHLPVQLFRAVIALMAVAMPFSASAARKYSVSGGQQLTLSGLDELDLNISGYYVSSATASGGAIYATGTGAVIIEHYVNVLFNKNYASSGGGAIYSSSGDITLSGNESVTFSDNDAYDGDGGAIYSAAGAITLSGNGSVTFSDNYATSDYYGATGGAIYTYNSGAITLSGNESVTFSGNYASESSDYAYGGAIGSMSGAITLSGNESVTFSGNYAKSDASDYARGGAIYSESGAITLSGNESVTFSGNYASSASSSVYGGAIFGKNIGIRDNGSVVFKQNYEKRSGTYRLRGLYATGNTALSSANGNYIEFQESMYVGGVLELNNLYTNEAGQSVAQTGDIIFTGAYTEEHLEAIKSDYTEEELRNSQTSDVAGMTTLYDGRLIVRGGAILSGAGLTVASSASGYSTPTVLLENAKLNHAGATVSFASGTHLEASGQSGIDCNNLTMRRGSALTLHAARGNKLAAVLSVYGSFTMGDSLTLNISFNDDTAEGDTYKLLQVNTLSNGVNWTSDKITVNGLEGLVVSFNDLYWEGDTLYLDLRGRSDSDTGDGVSTLYIGTWSNASGDGVWNTSSENWIQDEANYAYKDGVQVIFGDTGAGNVTLVGDLSPSEVLVDSSQHYTWNADATEGGKLTGSMELTKKGSGTLTINCNNDYTGGTAILGGSVIAGSATALGSGDVRLADAALIIKAEGLANNLSAAGNSRIETQSNGVLVLSKAILNTGNLTLNGSIDASALQLNGTASTYVDENGHVGESGFMKAEGFYVQVVSGGTVSGNAEVSHGSMTLTLGSDGYATFGGGINYDTYHLEGNDSVSVKDAAKASDNALKLIEMEGGTLYADATTTVAATAGNIILSEGVLSGSISGETRLSATGEAYINSTNTHTGGSIFTDADITLLSASALGNGSIMTMGDTTLTASEKVLLNSSILNSGMLTLSGLWDISALQLKEEAATRIDSNGHSGNSGFYRSERSEVQVVLGGTCEAENLILSHNQLKPGVQLVLGSDGVASAGGVVDYSNYLLTEGDSADASDILGAAGGKLDYVTMTGGNLNVDDSVEVDATGGKITITDDSTLSGSITDTEVTLGEGNYKSDISADITGDSSLTINGGDVTLSGNNSYTGGTVINGGSLTAGDDSVLGSGSITVNGGTLDLNDNNISNDITLNNGSLVGNDNYNGNLSIGGDNVTVEGGYTLAAGKVLEIAAGGTEFGSDLTLAGGTLLFKGAPLTVDGEVSFAAGTTTLVDLRQWEGQLVDGLTLAVLGNDITGWADGCLELIGMSDMSLGFDAATGTLTLQIAGQKPVADVITWLGAKQTVWQHGKAGWMNASTGYDAVYENGAAVIFTQAGTVTIAGAVAPESVIVAGDKAITFKSDKKNPGRIVGETSLTKRGNGKLTLNDGNTYSGGTFIEAGTVMAGGASSFGSGDISISGGTLDLKNKAVTNNITLTGVATIKGGSKFGGELTLDGELLKGSVLNVAEAAELKSGTMNGTLSGIGTVTVSGEATLGTTGKITTNGLDIEGTLNVGSKGLAMNAKSSVITVEEGGKLQSAGQLKAYSMDVSGGEVVFTTAKATSVTLGGDLRMSEGAGMSLSGKLNVGNLYMDNAQLLLRDPSGKNAAMGLTAKGNVTLGSGSALTLSGKLTAANLTLDGGALTLTSNKLQTITVKNTLTLGAAFDLNFSFNLTEGKAVKLFTFKSITGNTADLYAQLGLSDEFCTLTLNARDITLLVTDLDGLRGYMENTAKADASAAEPEEEEEVSAEELLAEAAPVAAAADIDPLLAKAADTLVQSTWGTAGASRAFGETIASRGRNATLLDDGKGAAWLSVMGGSSRISSAEGHNGADFTLSGAAFGVESRVGEKNTLGIAIGNSWGKVSTFSAFPVDQDSMHVGIYGNHTLTKSLTLSWMATHTRTESEATILGAPYSWSQDALQLDARLTWGKSISEKTAVSAFAGLQYLATDSGECAGLKTGSLQNLRAELGVGASHKCSESTLVFGELSFIGDMVRNNPTAAIGDYRTHGTNPGRVGLNLSVGAQHQLSEDWSLNASYSLELMENSTSHSLNVGASYSF